MLQMFRVFRWRPSLLLAMPLATLLAAGVSADPDPSPSGVDGAQEKRLTAVFGEALLSGDIKTLFARCPTGPYAQLVPYMSASGLIVHCAVLSHHPTLGPSPVAPPQPHIVTIPPGLLSKVDFLLIESKALSRENVPIYIVNAGVALLDMSRLKPGGVQPVALERALVSNETITSAWARASIAHRSRQAMGARVKGAINKVAEDLTSGNEPLR